MLRGTRTHQQANMLYVLGVCVRELAPFLDIGRPYFMFVVASGISEGRLDDEARTAR